VRYRLISDVYQANINRNLKLLGIPYDYFDSGRWRMYRLADVDVGRLPTDRGVPYLPVVLEGERGDGEGFSLSFDPHAEEDATAAGGWTRVEP
jgi:hypothetical protein